MPKTQPADFGLRTFAVANFTTDVYGDQFDFYLQFEKLMELDITIERNYLQVQILSCDCFDSDRWLSEIKLSLFVEVSS